jgi:hypothetical protein
MLALALVGMVTSVGADTAGTLVYEERFSADPGFQTNNPMTNHWDQKNGTFHFLLRDASGAYVYKTVPLRAGSFRLEFDFRLARSDPESNFRFGLGDTDMYPDEGTTIYLELENGEFGPIFWLRALDQNAHRLELSSQMDSYGGARSVHFSENVTYHALIDYNRDFRTISLQVINADDRSYVWGATLVKVGIYTNMDRIYFTTLNDVESAQSIAEGWIDNIQLTSYENVPDTVAYNSMVPTLVTPEQTPLATYTQLEMLVPGAAHTPPKTPLSLFTVIAAVCAAGVLCVFAIRRDRR